MLSTPPRESPAAGELPTPSTRMSPVSPTSPTLVQIFVVPTSMAAKVPLLTIAGYLPTRVNFVRDDSTPEGRVANATVEPLPRCRASLSVDGEGLGSSSGLFAIRCEVMGPSGNSAGGAGGMRPRSALQARR